MQAALLRLMEKNDYFIQLRQRPTGSGRHAVYPTKTTVELRATGRDIQLQRELRDLARVCVR